MRLIRQNLLSAAATLFLSNIPNFFLSNFLKFPYGCAPADNEGALVKLITVFLSKP
jgi:hypothetical protein